MAEGFTDSTKIVTDAVDHAAQGCIDRNEAIYA